MTTYHISQLLDLHASNIQFPVEGCPLLPTTLQSLLLTGTVGALSILAPVIYHSWGFFLWNRRGSGINQFYHSSAFFVMTPRELFCNSSTKGLNQFKCSCVIILSFKLLCVCMSSDVSFLNAFTFQRPCEEEYVESVVVQ
jgi:hypothetical protein